MSDHTITLIVNGAVTIVTVICGVLTLWLTNRKNAAAIRADVAKNTDVTVKAAAVTVQTAEADGGKGTPVVAAAKEAIATGSVSKIPCTENKPQKEP